MLKRLDGMNDNTKIMIVCCVLWVIGFCFGGVL